MSVPMRREDELDKIRFNIRQQPLSAHAIPLLAVGINAAALSMAIASPGLGLQGPLLLALYPVALLMGSIPGLLAEILRRNVTIEVKGSVVTVRGWLGLWLPRARQADVPLNQIEMTWEPTVVGTYNLRFRADDALFQARSVACRGVELEQIHAAIKQRVLESAHGVGDQTDIPHPLHRLAESAVERG